MEEESDFVIKTLKEIKQLIESDDCIEDILGDLNTVCEENNISLSDIMYLLDG